MVRYQMQVRHLECQDSICTPCLVQMQTAQTVQIKAHSAACELADQEQTSSAPNVGTSPSLCSVTSVSSIASCNLVHTDQLLTSCVPDFLEGQDMM